MTLKYTDKPYGGHGPQGITEDWKNRFPPNSQPMHSAPMGSRPIKVFEPSGQAKWALHHMGAWRGGSWNRDYFSGQWQWRLDGSLINNPVRWSSS
jgi:hypothetical protein